MKVKTYGVPELTEWQGKLKAGSIEVNVLFTGGTASPSGAQPAYFVTKDPITQFVIENSKEFKDGFIILLMQTEIPGEHPRMAIPKPQEVVQEQTKPVTEQTPAPMAVDANDNEGNNTQEEEASEEADNADDEGAGDDAPEGDHPLVVQVSSKTDAIEWLKEHYPEKGYTSTKLRTKQAFDAACAENNVVFEF